MKSVLSLITIFFLITSSIPFGFAEIEQTDALTSPNLDDSSTPQEGRLISISLHENIGIKSNQPPKKIPVNNINNEITSTSFGKLIILSESLDIKTSLSEQQTIIHSLISQPQTTLDRISLSIK